MGAAAAGGTDAEVSGSSVAAAARDSRAVAENAGVGSATAHMNADSPPGGLFGIVQGGMHTALRLASLESLMQLDFPGFAVGGLAVGEPERVDHRDGNPDAGVHSHAFVWALMVIVYYFCNEGISAYFTQL